MRKCFFLFFLLTTLGWTIKADDQVSFKASAPQSVVMGEQFRLTFVVNAEGKDLRVQEMPDFEVLMGPSQSTSYSNSWINGKSSSQTTVSYTYILMPKKEGTFTIAPATIKVKNATYTSNGLTIKVLPPDKSGKSNAAANASSTTISNDDFFVRMIVSDRDVYEQEGFLVTFKLYAARPCTLNGAKFPEFEGFLAQEIDLPNKQWVQDRYKDRNYFTVDLRQVVLYPQRSGQLTIGKGTYDAVIRISTPQKARSIFDDFFDTYRDVNKELVSQPATINVKPLPSGKPASFSGAVGDFTMTADINTDHVKANEAITLKLVFKGSGNLKYLKNPELKLPNDFDTYDPKVDLSVKATAGGVSGTRTVEYTTIPRFAGTFKIPAVEVSYFDTKSKEYKTLRTEEYEVTVDKGAPGSGGKTVSNFSNKEDLKLLNQDIHYIKLNKMKLVQTPAVYIDQWVYWLWYILPAVAFIVFVFINRKQAKANANVALMKNRKANKVALKRLKIAGKYLKNHDKEHFYDEVLKAVWGYLSDKLNIPNSELTKDNVAAELAKYGAGEELIAEFNDILGRCEFAQYAPAQSNEAMDELYNHTVEAIGKMENTVKK